MFSTRLYNNVQVSCMHAGEVSLMPTSICAPSNIKLTILCKWSMPSSQSSTVAPGLGGGGVKK